MFVWLCAFVCLCFYMPILLCTHSFAYLCFCVSMLLRTYVFVYLYFYVPVPLCSYTFLYLSTFVPPYINDLSYMHLFWCLYTFIILHPIFLCIPFICSFFNIRALLTFFYLIILRPWIYLLIYYSICKLLCNLNFHHENRPFSVMIF